jgi:hypothetical protein
MFYLLINENGKMMLRKNPGIFIVFWHSHFFHNLATFKKNVGALNGLVVSFMPVVELPLYSALSDIFICFRYHGIPVQ